MNKSFLEKDPFILVQKEKEKLFLLEIKEQAQWHYDNCSEFCKMCKNRNFDPFSEFKITDLPYIPVSMFKAFDLISVPENEVVKTLYSSSTSGRPSKIMLDKTTADNQILVLNKIMADFLGKQRRPFIIFDSEETIKSSEGELSSRGTAIRGMMSLASKMLFVLDKDLKLDVNKLKSALCSNACFFGFTWLIYNIFLENNKEIARLCQSFDNNLILHIGGWKKLKDLAVSKQEFNHKIGQMFHCSRIIDFYGMTEQLGTVYPDCEYGFKHAPLYSEIIIRDVNTLEPVKTGEPGFIQLLSPLPRSYPGISILSDDIGKVVGIDDCKCGRKGKYFVFEKRPELAEVKGCGDTLNI